MRAPPPDFGRRKAVLDERRQQPAGVAQPLRRVQARVLEVVAQDHQVMHLGQVVVPLPEQELVEVLLAGGFGPARAALGAGVSRGHGHTVPFRPLRAVGAGLRPAPTHEGYSIEVRSDNMGGDCYPAPPLAVKLQWLVAYPPPPMALRAISPSRGQRVVLRV